MYKKILVLVLVLLISMQSISLAWDVKYLVGRFEEIKNELPEEIKNENIASFDLIAFYRLEQGYTNEYLYYALYRLYFDEKDINNFKEVAVIFDKNRQEEYIVEKVIATQRGNYFKKPKRFGFGEKRFFDNRFVMFPEVLKDSLKIKNHVYSIDAEIPKLEKVGFEEVEDWYNDTFDFEKNYQKEISFQLPTRTKGDFEFTLYLLEENASDPTYKLTGKYTIVDYKEKEFKIDTFKMYVCKIPGQAREYNEIAIKLYQSGKYKQAIANYQKAIKIKPNYAQAFSNLSLSFYKKGDLLKALYANKKAIEYASHYSKTTERNIKASSYYNLGKIYEDKEEWDRAKEYYEKAWGVKEHKAYREAINRINEVIEVKMAIIIEDDNLEKVIREKINKPIVPLTHSDVEKIAKLDISGKEIKSVRGLENLSNLVELNASNNKIEEFSRFQKFYKLKKLDLSNNQILYDRYISDENMPNLKHLVLTGNKLEKINYIATFKKLEYLDLRNNNIEKVENIEYIKKELNYLQEIEPYLLVKKENK
ncbi:MAG: leucine-rich repeat protein [Candidatus Woesearchaeota archaeon]